MITVIGVRFKKAGKVYYFDPSGVWPRPGEYVVVETTRGVELGEVVTSAREVTDDQITQPLKKVLRAALEDDIQHAKDNERREKEAVPICQERIAAHKLDMKLIDVEYTFDNSKIIFYFTADGRVDFRELVKDLASIFKMRIELRQVGVRDEAKMLGGLGVCGRQVCCAAFLGDFQPLSIKMAKEQNLSLNPVKISGQCGRLMCCLRYEQDYYEQTLKKAPRVGAEVVTPAGVGTVSEIFVIREKIRVRIKNNDDSYDIKEFGLDEVHRADRRCQQAAQMTENESPEDEDPGDVYDADLSIISDFAGEDEESAEPQDDIRLTDEPEATENTRGAQYSGNKRYEKRGYQSERYNRRRQGMSENASEAERSSESQDDSRITDDAAGTDAKPNAGGKRYDRRGYQSERYNRHRSNMPETAPDAELSAQQQGDVRTVDNAADTEASTNAQPAGNKGPEKHGYSSDRPHRRSFRPKKK